jgi:hypothetical protein
MRSSEKIDMWFSSHRLSGDNEDKYSELKTAFKNLAFRVNRELKNGPDKNSALKLLREASWFVSGSIVQKDYEEKNDTSKQTGSG